MTRRSNIRLVIATISIVLLRAIAAFSQDADGDGVIDPNDNCVNEANPIHPLNIGNTSFPTAVRQIDADWDGYGNACDADFDQNGSVNLVDFNLFMQCFAQNVPGNGPGEDAMCGEADMDANGYVSTTDFALFLRRYSAMPAQPGPSRNSCADPTAPLYTTIWPCLSFTGYSGFPPVVVGNVGDSNYVPILATARYATGNGPVVSVDETHNNFHTAVTGGRYQGFARLLRGDGYTVQGFNVPFAAGCEASLATSSPCAYFQELCRIDTLVIANPQADITDEESRIIAGWVFGASPYTCNVSKPRRLLLISDHQDQGFNFPHFVRLLASRLGLVWPNATVGSNNLIFTSQSTTPPNQNPHPIWLGSNSGEVVESVTTFVGSAISGPSHGVPILRLPQCTMATNSTASQVRLSSYLGFPDAQCNDAPPFSQGTAFNHGSGRVYVSTEAAMFSAQAQELLGRFGMHNLPRKQNQQFLLNVMHWLDGAL